MGSFFQYLRYCNRKVVPLYSIYQAPPHEPDLTLLAPISTGLTPSSMVFILQLPCKVSLGSYSGMWNIEHIPTTFGSISQILMEWGKSFVHHHKIWQALEYVWLLHRLFIIQVILSTNSSWQSNLHWRLPILIYYFEQHNRHGICGSWRLTGSYIVHYTSKNIARQKQTGPTLLRTSQVFFLASARLIFIRQ